MRAELLQRRDAPRPATSVMPFRRDPATPCNTFTRTLTARVLASARGCRPSEIAARMWPSDRLTAELLERAASAPAMTTVTGWAAELAQRHVYDALEALGPASAGAQLLRLGLVLGFDGAGSISAPGFIAGAGNAAFVAEGSPIPVRQLAATAALLLAYKLASIAVLTREMIESSNAEALISDALMRSAGAALDAILFDSNAASAARPAGLRSGIAAIGASNASDAFEAVFEDVANLINAVAPVGGNGPYALIAAPGRAISMRARFGPPVTELTILGSVTAGNDLIAVAPAALVAALGTDPAIETSNATALQMNDAPAANFDSAAPAKSMWQTDSTALKLRWPVSWALRSSQGVAWTTPTWK